MRRLIFTLTLLFTLFNCANNTDFDYIIGISQISSHSALNKAKEGFKDVFKEAQIPIKFVETNANGEMATLELNSKKLINQNVDLVYAISTPAAQSIKKATNEIPIIFAAVTNAKLANLEAKNVTGILDSINPEYAIEVLLSLDQNIKKLGFLYNSGEQNSIIQLKELKEVAKKYDIQIIEKSATSISEIPQALDFLLNQCDALYTPSDNLIASSAKIIGQKALEKGKITIASENSQVDEGMLLSVGYDYYDMGRKAGLIALEILQDDKDVSEFEISTMSSFEKYVNKEVLKKLNLEDKWTD